MPLTDDGLKIAELQETIRKLMSENESLKTKLDHATTQIAVQQKITEIPINEFEALALENEELRQKVAALEKPSGGRPRRPIIR